MKDAAVKENYCIIPVVICTDHNYAKYASVTIQSLIENRANDCFYKIYIFGDEELLLDDKEKLNNMSKDNVAIECIDVSGLISKKDLYSRAHYSKQMFYRWLIPEVLPQYKKVIYLDCDLILESDVSELFNIDLDDKIVAAVRDITTNDMIQYYIKKDLKIEPNEYINSGVLVFNNKKFIEENIKDQCLNLLKHHSVFMCPDQDALNIALNGKIKLLPEEWNLQWGSIDLLKFNEGLKTFKIIHYTSEIKPWNTNYKNLPLAQSFWKYAEKCPFYDDILSLNTKTSNKIKAKQKKRGNFIRFLTSPFRFLKTFFISWKDVGFRNAMHELVFKFKYVFHRTFSKKNK